MIQRALRAANLAVTDRGKLRKYLGWELNHYGRRANQLYHRYSGPPDGFDLMERDWDTTIILDACRYDYFARENTIKGGELRSETSPASHSPEFITESFVGRNLHDTVYVTGNGWASILDGETFHKVYFEKTLVEGSPKPHPEKITDVAIEAHEKYPNKRVIVHYMQPHLPIMAPEAEHLNDSIAYYRGQYMPDGLSIEKFREGYAANLRFVLSEAERLIDTISGKIVITADHAELLGERIGPIPVRGYEHNETLYTPNLITVPWFELENGDRREIMEDPPVGEFEVDEEKRDERLEALGYL